LAPPNPSAWPDGQVALPKHPALRIWHEAIAARPSFQASVPPMPGQAAA
jgi:hypothetical protein